MSKDPSTRVGAVIVRRGSFETLGAGFNGFPAGIAETPERMADRDLKMKLVVHGEMAAVLDAARRGNSLHAATLYLVATDGDPASSRIWGGCPCTRCTVESLHAGIGEVVTLPFKEGPSKWRADIEFAAGLLREAGVVYREIPLSEMAS